MIESAPAMSRKRRPVARLALVASVLTAAALAGPMAAPSAADDGGLTTQGDDGGPGSGG